MVVPSFIAQYLRAHGYRQTLAAFEAEHGNLISPETPIDETLEDIITDRIKYLSTGETAAPGETVLTADLQKIKDAQLTAWSTPFPKTPTAVGRWKELVVDCAVMEISGSKYILCCTSGKSLVVLDFHSGGPVSEIKNAIGTVVRKVAVCEDLVLLCGMNGLLSIGRFSAKLDALEILSETQIHRRLVADMRVVRWNGAHYVVSMGWDFFVKVFRIEDARLELVGEHKLSSQGSCFDAAVHQGRLFVAVCKKEITLMDVLSMEPQQPLRRELRIALNDAEFSAAGFTPMCVRIHVSQGVPLVAVATSHEPYMRIVLVTLKDAGAEDAIYRNQILVNANTMSPQDKYSEAKVEWRADGSGIWVFGEDGKVRGLDLDKAAVAVELDGHAGRIRCVVAGDALVTCGTDKTVMKWV